MILVTGISGNTGSFVLKKLVEQIPANKIVGIIRSLQYENKYNIQLEYGDLYDLSFLESVYKKYAITEVIHIVNIRLSEDIMLLSDKYNVKRNILVHTTGIFSKYQEYNSLYNQIENKIINNSYKNTSYVIVRPSMIYGNEKDYNMHKLIKFLNKTPIFPVFGDGKSLMQPIHVEDLSNAIIKVFDRKDIINEDFNITGQTILEYQQIIKLISKKLNKKIRIIKIPISIAILGAKVSKMILRKNIITVEQIERLQENKVYSHDKAKKVFGFNPRSFEQGITEEIATLKEKGIIKV